MTLLRQNRFVNKLTVGLIMFIMYGAVFYFSWYTKGSIVLMKDQWHYLTMVTGYYQNGFDFHLITLRHGEHLQLAYNAWFLLNGILFGLNTRMELFIGLFFLGGFLWILYLKFNASLDQSSPALERQVMFLPMLLIALSFNQQAIFNYSLLSFCSFGETLFMMFFISELNEYFSSQNPKNKNLMFIGLSFVLLGLGFAGGGWVIYLIVALLTMGFWIIVNRPFKRHIIKLVVLMIFLCAFSIWVNSFGGGQPVNSISQLIYVFHNIDQAVLYILILLANSVINVNWFEAKGLMNLVYGIGVGVGGVYLFSAFLFIKTKMWEKTYIPLYLMLFFWLVAIALLMNRFQNFGIGNAASPRYVTTLQIGLLGCLWVVIYWVNLLPKSKGDAMWLAIWMMVGIPYVFHLSVAIHLSPFYRNFYINASKTVLNERFSERGVVCPNELFCKEGVITLKEHKLNVFHGN